MLLESILDGIPLTIFEPRSVQQGLTILFCATTRRPRSRVRAHRTSEVHSNAGKEEASFARAHPWTSKPSDGLTKSFKTGDMLINLEREVGLVPGLDTNGLSWIRTFQRGLQLLAERVSSLLEGSVASKFSERIA